jgi:hypothetical protein
MLLVASPKSAHLIYQIQGVNEINDAVVSSGFYRVLRIMSGRGGLL